MRNSTVILAMIAATVQAPSVLGVGFTFETVPLNGQVNALPGATAGWGYRVHNPTTDWLELTNLSSDVFFNGTAASLFDLPVLAPGQSRVVTWVRGVAGLFEFTWDLSAPLNSFNSGRFILEGVFWDGDPLSGGAITGQADPQSTDYRVTAASTAIPEPGAFGLLALLLPVMWILAQSSVFRLRADKHRPGAGLT